MHEHDLVIRGGSVVDGTGEAARTADVAVSGGVVTEVGKVDGRGAREVDADGLHVLPGWVDIHAHYDGQATWDNHLAPSSWQGVTTVVMGNCGVGFAPVREADHDALIELMEGVEDIPGAALHEGLPWTWRSFAEFLDAVDSLPHDIDVAAQVPHGALRLHVMGERGANREDATPDDIAEMGRIAAEAIVAGGLGFTTSRTRNHRTSRGEYTPTLTAHRDELVGIAEAIGATGQGVLQLVSDFLDPDDEFETLRQMVLRSGRPLSFSLAANPVVPDAYKVLLSKLTSAVEEDGLPMRAQVATRAVGLLLGLQCTLNPFLANKVFSEGVAGLKPAEAAAKMADPSFKAAVLDNVTGEKAKGKLGGGLIGMFDRMFELGDPPNYEPDPSSSILARARREGREPEEFVWDVLAADEGRTFLYLPFLNWIDEKLDAVGEMLAHPYTVPGLGDGGAHVGTICDGSFPTTLLTMWGRDRSAGRLGIEDIVRRQCRETARTVGLHDRGVLAPGYRADINVVDLASLGVRRPVMRFDLPAGGKRLLQEAEGYRHTFVLGEETFVDGEATGALPGRLVRGAQPAPA